MKHKVSDGFPYYIECAGNKDYKQLFSSKEYIKLLGALSEEQSTYRYTQGKWSIKQIIGHITDHERIMTYRALRFSRRDNTLLPGYEQDLYVKNSRFDELTLKQLLNDLDNVRNATLSFIESLSPEQLLLTGKAWKFELTIEDFLKATIGHEIHHLEIIKQKYLIK
tara:strand:+ start:6233 stop:6730 length:498 start_codon:yes stop_codon:yes gene_type:complete